MTEILILGTKVVKIGQKRVALSSITARIYSLFTEKNKV